MTQGGIKKFCNMPRAIEKIYDLKRVFKKNLQKVNTDLQICRFAFYTKKSGYGGMKKFCTEIEKGQRFLVTLNSVMNQAENLSIWWPFPAKMGIG